MILQSLLTHHPVFLLGMSLLLGAAGLVARLSRAWTDRHQGRGLARKPGNNAWRPPLGR
ncbi:MAG TPA: hypothetical protein VGC74_02480 [Stenotrophomonas sp.]|jgi:hypothetical protein